jgi:hypothetical protein
MRTHAASQLRKAINQVSEAAAAARGVLVKLKTDGDRIQADYFVKAYEHLSACIRSCGAGSEDRLTTIKSQLSDLTRTLNSADYQNNDTALARMTAASHKLAGQIATDTGKANQWATWEEGRLTSGTIRTELQQLFGYTEGIGRDVSNVAKSLNDFLADYGRTYKPDCQAA